jgi:hypothetical protein
VIPDGVIDGFVSACRSNKFDKMDAAIGSLLTCGYSGYQFLLQVHNQLIAQEHDFSDGQKAVMGEKIAVSYFETVPCHLLVAK